MDGATEEVQLDRSFRIVVTNHMKSSRRRDLDSKLLAQLPAQAGLQRLARLTLASGELPESSQVCSRFPASDQITTFVEDHTCCNLNL